MPFNKFIAPYINLRISKAIKSKEELFYCRQLAKQNLLLFLVATYHKFIKNCHLYLLLVFTYLKRFWFLYEIINSLFAFLNLTSV
jgi:hypothetical protein